MATPSIAVRPCRRFPPAAVLSFGYCLPQTACPAAYLPRTRITDNYFVFINIVESQKTAFFLPLFSATFRLRSHVLGRPFLPELDRNTKHLTILISAAW
jgi:hypothetical protein